MSEDCENKTQEWQDVLRSIFEDDDTVLKLAEELGMHPDSLKRWTQGTIPRNPLRTMRSLLKASSFPEQYTDAFIEAVRKTWPDFELAVNPLLQDLPAKEIPSIFYSQIFRSFAYVADDLAFWTLTNSICHQLFGHLDADKSAHMSALILRCTPPIDRYVQSFFVPILQIGERPSPLQTTFPLLVGLESPLTDVTPRYQRPLIFGERDIMCTNLPFRPEVLCLLCLPIQRRGKVAGCLVVSVQKPDSWWNEQRVMVAFEYGTLFGLAFGEQDFWSKEQLCLQTYPAASVQEQLERSHPFRQRMAALRREHSQISQDQLEVLALQELEQDLLKLGK